MNFEINIGSFDLSSQSRGPDWGDRNTPNGFSNVIGDDSMEVPNKKMKLEASNCLFQDNVKFDNCNITYFQFYREIGSVIIKISLLYFSFRISIKKDLILKN